MQIKAGELHISGSHNASLLSHNTSEKKQRKTNLALCVGFGNGRQKEIKRKPKCSSEDNGVVGNMKQRKNMHVTWAHHAALSGISLTWSSTLVSCRACLVADLQPGRQLQRHVAILSALPTKSCAWGMLLCQGSKQTSSYSLVHYYKIRFHTNIIKTKCMEICYLLHEGLPSVFYWALDKRPLYQMPQKNTQQKMHSTKILFAEC